MNITKASISAPIKGDTGKNLYMVTKIDLEDADCSTSELYLARDEAHVEEMLKAEVIGKDEMGTEMEDRYDNGEMGIDSRITLIGTVA